MPVFDGLSAVQQVLHIIKTVTIISFTTWLVSGGFWYMVRFASFLIDKMLVQLCSILMEKINLLIENQLFNEEVTKLLLRNIYIFIGLIVFFKLAVMVINLIVDPDQINSRGISTDKIVQRILFGMIGLILAPMITTSLVKVQKAIVDDGIIQKVLIPPQIVNKTEQISSNAGGYAGTHVLMGFITPNSNASNLSKLKYARSLKTGQILININEGQNIGFGTNHYHYDYYPIISTIVLGFAVSILFYFALDVAVRYFNLLFFQLLAPFAFVDYMVKGKDSQILNKWFKGLAGCFLVVFIRLISVWILCMFLVLMGAGTGGNLTQGTLISGNDQFVNTLIILAILGFTKDLPKKLSDMFGLDFIQDSSATGFAKQALSIGGAIAGAGAALGVKGLKMGGKALGAGGKKFSANAQKQLGAKIDAKNKSAYKQIQSQAALPPEQRDKRWANYSTEQLQNPTAADVKRQNRFNKTDNKKKQKAYVAERLGKDVNDVTKFDEAKVRATDMKDNLQSSVKEKTDFVKRSVKDGAEKAKNFAKHPVKSISQWFDDGMLSEEDTREYYGLDKDDKVTKANRLSATLGKKLGVKNLAVRDEAPEVLAGKDKSKDNKTSAKNVQSNKGDDIQKEVVQENKQVTRDVDTNVDVQNGEQNVNINEAEKVPKLMDGVLEEMKTQLSAAPFKEMGKAFIHTTGKALFSLSSTTKAAFDSYENILDVGDGTTKKMEETRKANMTKQLEEAKKVKQAEIEAADRRATEEFRAEIRKQNEELIRMHQQNNNDDNNV